MSDENRTRPASATVPCYAAPNAEQDVEQGQVKMLAEDNRRMRKAGHDLAMAALRVARDYDGVHRLLLAVSNWAEAVANEGRRPHGEAEGAA